MPIYTLEGPDGKKYRIEGPEGATAEQLSAFVQSAPASKEDRVKAQEAADREAYNPTAGMSGVDKFRAGVGKSMTDLARGVGQMANPVMDVVAPRQIGLSNLVLDTKPESRVEQGRREISESRSRDSSLMNTGAGAVGNFAGNVAMLAPTAMIPGANTVAGAGLIGATTGLLQPSTSTKETLLNIGLGGAGGAAGQKVANTLPGMAQAWKTKAADEAASQGAAAAQKFAAATKANQLGYVVPPADLNPGMLSEALSGMSGKIKTAQVASQRNQGVTDKLARKALGLADDAVLDADALQSIRRQAGQAYDSVKQIGPVQADKVFMDALDSIASTQQGAGRSFPGLQNNGVVDLVASLKQQSFDAGDAVDATKVLREVADKAYRQGDTSLGKAAKEASNALEGVLERNLQAAGNPDALKAFQDARKLIAKTYTVQKGLNAETGSVSAQALAKELAKGKPLSGELKDVAQFGAAFPKASQALKEAPKSVSPLDFAFAGGSAVGTGNPLALMMVGARPAVRNALLSPMAQRAALNPGFAPSALSQMAPAVLDNQLLKLLGAPSGIAGGLALQGQQ